VALSLGRGKQVLVVTQPYISDSHVEQQNQMASMLRKNFGSVPGFHYVSLGKTIDLKNRALAFDGMHLSPAGNRLIAGRLVPPVMKILK
jgi:lysophospholipase L1-like esterase